MTGRVGGLVRGAATALTSLVLAHNLIFLSGYGAEFGRAMAVTGHDQGWTVTVLISLSLGCALLLATIWRLSHLRRLARDLGAGSLPIEPGLRAFMLRWLLWWSALVLATAMLFVLQENMEQARVTQHLPGLGVLLSSTYPHAVAIIAVVALAVSLVAALLSWKIDVVVARILAMQSAGRAGIGSTVTPGEPVDRRRGSILGGSRAGRAPPVELAP